MSQNSSNDIENNSVQKKTRTRRDWLSILILPAWVFVSFIAAQQVTIALLWVLRSLNMGVASLNENVLATVLAAFIYVVTIGLVIGLPWLIRKQRTTKADIGLQGLPFWKDILMAPAGLVIYIVLSTILTIVATVLIPGFDVTQPQDTGFTGITKQYEFILAFMTLVVIAPIAEEVLFRGYLFGKLRKYVPVWVAILVTSIFFGALHGAWNVAVDTFALSVILCLLRLSTNSLWAPILLHMIKNGIAFFALFVYPVLNGTIGG